MNYTEERKHLIGLIAYRFAERCFEEKVDGYWISNMIKITSIVEEFDFEPFIDDNTICTDLIFDEIENIVDKLLKEELENN